MVEEGDAQLTVGAGPLEASLGCLSCRFDRLGTEVGQFDAFAAAPQQLDRVELGGRRKPSTTSQLR